MSRSKNDHFLREADPKTDKKLENRKSRKDKKDRLRKITSVNDLENLDPDELLD